MSLGGARPFHPGVRSAGGGTCAAEEPQGVAMSTGDIVIYGKAG
jgi:hypothetical protein